MCFWTGQRERDRGLKQDVGTGQPTRGQGLLLNPCLAVVAAADRSFKALPTCETEDPAKD